MRMNRCNYLIIINNMMKKVNEKMGIKLKSLVVNAYYFRFQICGTLAVLSLVYLLLTLFEIRVLIGFAVFLMSIFGLVYFWWRSIKQKGIINIISPKARDVLLRRSIADLFRDQVYYPYFTKIIGVFVKAAVSKPHPEELEKLFEEELPENVKKAIFTKGILHLAPQKVEKLVLEREVDLISEIAPAQIHPKPQTLVPKSYGTVNQMWDRRVQYQGQVVKIHELTISKQILNKLNKKINWGHVIMLSSLLSFVVMKLKGRKLGKILLYNSSVMGIFMLAFILVVKYKSPLKEYKKKIERKLE